MIRTDLDREELVKELETLRQRVAELEEFQFERQRGEETQPQIEANERYRAILESSDDGLIVLDRKDRVINANEKLKEIIGYEIRDLVGRTILSLARLLTNKGLTVMWRNPLKRTVGVNMAPYEVDVLKKDGQLVTVQIKYHPFKVDGTIIGRLVILRDVTSRTRAEKESRESQEVYKSLVNHVGVGVFRTTPGATGRFLEVNPAMEEITGYSREELLQLDVAELYVHPEERADIVKEVLSGMPVKPREVHFKKKDGTEILVMDKKVAVRGNDSKTLYLEGFLEDITERKRIEARISQQSSLLQSVIESIDSPIFSIGTNYCYTSFNRSHAAVMRTLFGADIELSKSVLGYHTVGEDRNIAKMNLDRALRGERFTVESFTGDEALSRQYFEIYHGPIRDSNRDVTGAVVYARNLTENKRANEERKKIEEALCISDAKYKDLYENAPIAYYSVGTDGSIKDFNKAFQLWLGFSSYELQRMNVFNIYAEESRARVRVIFDKFQQGLTFENEELVYRRKNGENVYGLLTLSAIRDECGQVVASRSVVRDITEDKQAEEALRESEERYRSLFKNMINGYAFCKILVDEENKPVDFLYIEVNEAFEKLTGLKKGDVIGKKVTDAIPSIKVVNPEMIPIYGEVAATGRPTAFEVFFKPLDMWLAISVYSPQKDYFVAVFDNITERKQIEEVLRRSEENSRAYMENAPDGIYINDLKGKFLYGNKKAEEIMGYKREELLGRNFLEIGILPKKQMATAAKLLLLNIMGQSTGPDEFELVRKDGSRVWVEINTTPVKQEGKVQVIGFVRDITDRKKTDEKIRQAAEEWRNTFDSISDPVSIQDKDFRILRVNKAYADLFKKKPQELLGKSCYELVHGTDRPVQDCPHQRTLQTGRPATEEFFEPHLGISLEMTTSPILDEQGKIFGSVHVARDITKRKQMEQQLALNSRLASIGELAAGVAHELNNPLTSVIGFSQLLMGREIPDDIKEDLTLVHSEAQRAAVIVKNLLTFARAHAPVKQQARIENILGEVLRLRAYEQKVNNIQVVSCFATDLPEVSVDYSQIQQVFLNLIINAEYFMTEANKRGTLTITAEKVHGMVRISFADDGHGITIENMKRIFNPFFTTKEVGKGTGLGLSICHGIVTEHMGKIYVRSQVGAGATFVVELPIDSQQLGRRYIVE